MLHSYAECKQFVIYIKTNSRLCRCIVIIIINVRLKYIPDLFPCFLYLIVFEYIIYIAIQVIVLFPCCFLYKSLCIVCTLLHYKHFLMRCYFLQSSAVLSKHCLQQMCVYFVPGALLPGKLCLRDKQRAVYIINEPRIYRMIT